MKNFLILVAMVAAIFAGYDHYKSKSVVITNETMLQASSRASAPSLSQEFRCDGRTRCPQMRSCAEAKYFIQHCPNTEMDGDNDGIPCERQWCN